ncbi:MAG: hypothetical protein A3F09_03090 [Chlamydiae bacterium RIFCSPHIGHO2_12_FULL_49_11]|nr:MAG: hypothetical protein A3F09_03090 [Chlamydiae bacterium RIFCSPHIGHO2_12_FULL_49_11]
MKKWLLVLIIFSSSAMFALPRRPIKDDEAVPMTGLNRQFRVNNAVKSKEMEENISKFERGWLIFISAAIFGICFGFVKDHQGTTSS